MISTDKSLISRLFRMHYGLFLAAAIKCGRTQDADDAIQDAMLVVSRKKFVWNDEKHAVNSIARIVCNKALTINMKQRQRRNPTPVDDDRLNLIPINTTCDEIDLWMTTTHLEDKLRELAKTRPVQAEVLRLKALEEKTYAEIGEILNLTYAALTLHISRARRWLRTNW